MGLTPSGAVFERAYRVEVFSIKCEHLLSCFFSPFGDWWKFSSVSSFKYCTYSYLKEYQFRQKVQHKYADMAELADAADLGSASQEWGFKSLYPHQKEPKPDSSV